MGQYFCATIVTFQQIFTSVVKYWKNAVPKFAKLCRSTPVSVIILVLLALPPQKKKSNVQDTIFRYKVPVSGAFFRNCMQFWRDRWCWYWNTVGNDTASAAVAVEKNKYLECGYGCRMKKRTGSKNKRTRRSPNSFRNFVTSGTSDVCLANQRSQFRNGNRCFGIPKNPAGSMSFTSCKTDIGITIFLSHMIYGSIFVFLVCPTVAD